MRNQISIALISLLAAAIANAGNLTPLPPQPADVPWPTAEWPTGAMPSGVDTAEFQAAMADAFDKRAEGLGETRELVVIQGGRLVHEQYAPGYTPDMRLVS